jgi:hypothetical protein
MNEKKMPGCAHCNQRDRQPSPNLVACTQFRCWCDPSLCMQLRHDQEREWAREAEAERRKDDERRREVDVKYEAKLREWERFERYAGRGLDIRVVEYLPTSPHLCRLFRCGCILAVLGGRGTQVKRRASGLMPQCVGMMTVHSRSVSVGHSLHVRWKWPQVWMDM